MHPKRDNQHGHRYFEAPSPEVLDDFYSTKYFGENTIYSDAYTEAEVRFFNASAKRKIELLKESRGIDSLRGLRVLEVGVGEGWGLSALADAGADVLGVDYSPFPCETHNPGVLDRLQAGVPDERLRVLRENGVSFDVIWLDNVLEHTPDPRATLESLKGLLSVGGQLLIEVPNDFSELQSLLLDEKLVSRRYWVSYPDHLSYFTVPSLESLLTSCGFEQQDVIADFPIDLFLLNEASNYVDGEPGVGKCAHRARLHAEALLDRQSPTKVIQLYRSMASVGLGRNIISLSRIQPVKE